MPFLQLAVIAIQLSGDAFVFGGLKSVVDPPRQFNFSGSVCITKIALFLNLFSKPTKPEKPLPRTPNQLERPFREPAAARGHARSAISSHVRLRARLEVGNVDRCGVFEQGRSHESPKTISLRSPRPEGNFKSRYMEGEREREKERECTHTHTFKSLHFRIRLAMFIHSTCWSVSCLDSHK